MGKQLFLKFQTCNLGCHHLHFALLLPFYIFTLPNCLPIVLSFGEISLLVIFSVAS